MATITVTKDSFDADVAKSELPVLLDFWAPWCGPCKMAEPVLDELSDQYEGKVVIGKLNVDEFPEISNKYAVMSIPTTILFKSGGEVGRQTGFSGKKAFEDLIIKGGELNAK